ncbi:MAG TPA: F0F1 ATP synthase subunit delta [Candidatus Dormibacteraeota bacterium]|nr:F0F1 ATP synthase subunit delta [Candidatus Dormibacteraeota bacterium]
MKLARHQLAAILGQRSLIKVDRKALAHEVAAYLLSEGRTAELDSLIRDVMEYRSQHGIVEVSAVSAFPLDEQAQSEISAQVSNQLPGTKQLIIDQSIDKNMIGGVKIEFANRQLDLSIRSKLNRFKQLTTSGKD